MDEKSRIRVAFYSDSHEIGGAETSLRNLLSALSPRVEATVVGVDSAVVDWVAAGRPGSVTVVLPPIAGKWDLRAIGIHVRAFRRLRPQIVHVSLADPWASHWALLAAIATRGLRVITVEQSTWQTRKLRRRTLKRLLAHGLAAQVAVGTASADAAAAFSGVPRDRIRIIHNGVPDDEVVALPRSISAPVLGAVGRLEHEKGFDILIQALVEVPGASAVLVGDGRRRKDLVDLAERVGVSDRVVFAGWNDEPRRYLPTFDLYVLPSRIEGFPLALVEAMLAGLPVVATEVGSVSDAVIEGDTGLLVPPDDPKALAHAIRTLLADRGRMQEMARRGRERARRQFTANAMAARFESLYDELVG